MLLFISPQFAKFIVVGALTAGVYYLAICTIDLIFKINFYINILQWESAASKARFEYLTSVSIAYFIAFSFQFFANKICTFRDKRQLKSNQIIRYAIVIITNYALTIVTTAICVEAFLMLPYTGVWISLLLTTPVGFFLSKYWVFKI